MEDKLVNATAKNGMVRIIGAVTTNLVNDGCRMHDTTPVASAAFGRMLTAGTLMGSMLKEKKK